MAALIRSQYPEMKAPEVINRILKTAKDTGAPGVDNLYGYGIIDAQAAVTATVPAVSENPLGTISEWIRVHRRNTEKTTDTPAPGVSMEKSDLKQVAAPKPILPDDSAPALQPVLIVGGGVLLLLVLIAGSTQTLVRRRREKAAAQLGSASLSSLQVPDQADGRDLFDEIPEEDR